MSNTYTHIYKRYNRALKGNIDIVFNSSYEHINNVKSYNDTIVPIGIYIIRNKETNMVYIGKSTDNILNRISQHITLLIKGNHSNKYLQHDYNRYGYDSFEFIVLDFYNKDTHNKAKLHKTIKRLEYNYIKQYNPHIYNVIGTTYYKKIEDMSILLDL